MKTEWLKLSALLNAPLFLKITGIALAVIVLLASGLFLEVYTGWHEDELSELEENGRLLGNLAVTRCLPMLQNGDIAGLKGALREISGGVVGVNSIEVRDAQGRVLGATDVVDPRARVRRIDVPITAGIGGTVSVSMSEANVDAELASLTRRLLLTIAIIAGIGTAGAWWVARIFTRPIRELVQKIREVKAGDLEARAQVLHRDEIGELAGAFNEMVAELQEREAVEHQLLRKLISAEDEERKRLARELHDHTGQALTSLITGLAALKSDARSPRQFGELLDVATQALSEVHDLSRTLRPVALDEFGLNIALKKLCETCSQRLGLTVNCETTGFGPNARLPQSLEIAVYRVCQEAVTNAVRHGKACTVDLVVHCKPGSVLAVIEDNGKGFDVTGWRARCLRGDHLGLLSMEQRATLLGGTMRIESRPGGGTSLFIEFPLKAKLRESVNQTNDEQVRCL